MSYDATQPIQTMLTACEVRLERIRQMDTYLFQTWVVDGVKTIWVERVIMAETREKAQEIFRGLYPDAQTVRGYLIPLIIDGIARKTKPTP